MYAISNCYFYICFTIIHTKLYSIIWMYKHISQFLFLIFKQRSSTNIKPLPFSVKINHIQTKNIHTLYFTSSAINFNSCDYKLDRLHSLKLKNKYFSLFLKIYIFLENGSKQKAVCKDFEEFCLVTCWFSFNWSWYLM